MSIATQRTELSPRCCATSSTRREPLLIVSSALRISGRWPSNFTSTTAPIPWVTRPVGLLAFAISIVLASQWAERLSAGFNSSKRLGARDDFDQFLGDHRLARAIVSLRQLLDHVAGVARCVIHRAHLRAVERGHVFEQSAVN